MALVNACFGKRAIERLRDRARALSRDDAIIIITMIKKKIATINLFNIKHDNKRETFYLKLFAYVETCGRSLFVYFVQLSFVQNVQQLYKDSLSKISFDAWMANLWSFVSRFLYHFPPLLHTLSGQSRKELCTYIL